MTSYKSSMIFSRWGFSPSCTFPFAPFTLKLRLDDKEAASLSSGRIRLSKNKILRRQEGENPRAVRRPAGCQLAPSGAGNGPKRGPNGPTGRSERLWCAPGMPWEHDHRLVCRSGTYMAVMPSCPRAGMVQLYDPFEYRYTSSHGEYGTAV